MLRADKVFLIAIEKVCLAHTEDPLAKRQLGFHRYVHRRVRFPDVERVPSEQQIANTLPTEQLWRQS
jgi:hypothetical protein